MARREAGTPACEIAAAFGGSQRTVFKRLGSSGRVQVAGALAHRRRGGGCDLVEPSAPLAAGASRRADPYRHQEAGPARTGHRNTGPGWDFVHIAVDDATGLAYAEVLPAERRASAPMPASAVSHPGDVSPTYLAVTASAPDRVSGRAGGRARL